MLMSRGYLGHLASPVSIEPLGSQDRLSEKWKSVFTPKIDLKKPHLSLRRRGKTLRHGMASG